MLQQCFPNGVFYRLMIPWPNVNYLHTKRKVKVEERANPNSKHGLFGKIFHACTAEETCGSQTTLFLQQSLQSSLEGLDELSSMALESMDETLDFNETLMDVDDSTSMVSTYKNGGRTG